MMVWKITEKIIARDLPSLITVLRSLSRCFLAHKCSGVFRSRGHRLTHMEFVPGHVTRIVLDHSCVVRQLLLNRFGYRIWFVDVDRILPVTFELFVTVSEQFQRAVGSGRVGGTNAFGRIRHVSRVPRYERFEGVFVFQKIR